MLWHKNGSKTGCAAAAQYGILTLPDHLSPFGGTDMKTKVTALPYAQVLSLPAPAHRRPRRPSLLLRTLVRALSVPELRSVRFTYQCHGMERLGKDEPCLILMNHSSFIDLKIASAIFYPRPFNIVCTSDGFVGKEKLMRALGCIPTQKFVSDAVLVRDMLYAVRQLKSSVLLYPEASYSFDGTATPLPDSLGKCLKLLRVPVVMVRTYGAFAHDPLYNGLQPRKVPVRADVTYLLSPEEIAAQTPAQLNELLRQQFSFDSFRWQQEQGLRIREPFRADGLNRVLYKCPHCLTEGQMTGKGTLLTCGCCGRQYELTELGALRATNGEAAFTHVPDWFRWERECVRRELTEGRYALELPVDICMLVDMRSIYRVGSGTLRHDAHGFQLTGCGGQLRYSQSPAASYSLYSDYFWYELGDMICIGDSRTLYYCFPQHGGDVVAKTRLAAEELYRLTRSVPAGISI